MINLYINKNAVRRAVFEAFRAGRINETDPVQVHHRSEKQADGSVERGFAVYLPRVGDRNGFYL